MRATVAALLLVLPLAGCLEDDVSTQSIGPEPQWFVAQADAATGDVAGFVWTIPDRLCTDPVGVDVTATASPEGAQAEAGGASASAGPGGAAATVDLACSTIHASAAADGHHAHAEAAAELDAALTLDDLSLEVVPDVSALGSLHQSVVLVFTITDGVATQVATSLATQVEKRVVDAQNTVSSEVLDAAPVPFVLPLEGLDLSPGDTLAFAVAAQAEAEAEIKGIVEAAAQGAVSATASLPVDAVDYGIAFRLVEAAAADAEAAVAALESLAASAAGQVDAQVETAVSLLDRVAASAQAEVLAAVGQAQGFDIGFFGELTRGVGDAAVNVRYLTDSLSVSYTMESAARVAAATEELTLSYEGVAVDGWGFGLGAYGGAENGQVDYDIQAQVHDQSFSSAGSITAAGPFSIGDADPSYVLSGAGQEAQTLVWELARKANEEATALFTLHVDISADLSALVGVTSVVPATPDSLVGGIPVLDDGVALRFDAGALGPVRLAIAA